MVSQTQLRNLSRTQVRQQVLKERAQKEQRRILEEQRKARQKEIQKEQAKYDKIKSLIASAQSVDKGNAFWGYNRSKQEIQELNEFRKGIGEGTKKEKRAQYLIEKFPDIPEGTIRQIVEQGTVTNFSSGASRINLDKGETRKITIRDTATGEIKREEVLKGVDGGYEKTTTKYTKELSPTEQPAVKSKSKTGQDLYSFLESQKTPQQRELVGVLESRAQSIKQEQVSVSDRIKSGFRKTGQDILTGATVLTNIPTITLDEKGKPKVSTLRKDIAQTYDVAEKKLTQTAKGTQKITKRTFEAIGVPTEKEAKKDKTIKLYQKSTMSGEPEKLDVSNKLIIPEGTKTTTLAGDISTASGSIPYLAAYSTPLLGGYLLAGQTAKGVETLSNLDEEVKMRKEKEYEYYRKNVVPEEGERLLTKEEFMSNYEINKEVKNAITREAKLNIAIPVGIVVTAGLIKTGKKVFKKEFKVFEEPATYTEQSKAYNVMSPKETIITTKDGLNVVRGFKGEGASTTSRTGQRVIYESPFQKFFGMKPTYAGESSGGYLVRGGKVLKISREEAREGYKKALESLQDMGLKEKEARNFLRRRAPTNILSSSEYSGALIGTEEGTGAIFKGTRKTINVKTPQLVDIGGGRKVVSISKGGKIKIEKIDTGTKELGVKGEIGEVGERTFYAGESRETNPFAQLGKRTKNFQEGAVVKKVGEKPIKDAFGKIELYKAGEVSREVTYKKPRRITTSSSDITVINPDIAKRDIIDLVTGTKVEKVKPQVLGKDIQIKAEEFVKINEEMLGFKTGVGKTIKPAKIEKTPLSKTFAEEKPIKVIEETPKKETQPVLKTERKTPEIDTTKLAEETTEILKVEKPSKTNVKIEPPKQTTKITGKASIDTTIPTQTTQSKTFEKQEIQQKTKQETRTVQIQPQKLNLDFKQATTLKEKLTPAEKLSGIQKLGTEQKLDLRMRQTTPLKQKQTVKPPKPIKTRTPIPPPKKPTSTMKTIAKAIKEEDGFEVFTRKKGEDISIGKFKTKQKAESALAKELKSTLRASGFISRKGEKIKAEKLGIFGGEFGKSKIDATRIVQKKTKRLGTKSEVFEIQSTKRRKVKGGGWL